MGIELELQKKSNEYWFKEHRQVISGSFLITILIAYKTVITGNVAVVQANLPFPTGHNLLHKYKLYVKKLKNTELC